jgi:hypothetical protein
VLETLQVGGTRCTSLAALQRFFDRLSRHGDTAMATADRAVAQKAEQAEQELDHMWSRQDQQAAKTLITKNG